MPLDEQRRSQLDSIVQRMAAEGEPDETIQIVVSDFKSKYEGAGDTSRASLTSSGNETQDLATQQGSFRGSDLLDVAKGFGKQALGSVYQMGDLIRRGLGMDRVIDTPEAQSAITPTNPLQQLGGALETMAEMVPVGVGVIKAARATPGVVTRALGMNKVRAVSNLESAAKAAKGITVDVEAPGQAALRIVALKDTGAKGVPMAVNRFVQRITNPEKGAMTFDEARQFYSNLTRLSVNERNAMNGTVKYELGGLVRALSDSLTKAAGTVGKADDYTAGMTEYAKAARASRAGRKVAKAAGVGAAGTVGAAGAYSLIQSILGGK